jgi:hypothetical protein
MLTRQRLGQEIIGQSELIERRPTGLHFLLSDRASPIDQTKWNPD